MTRRRYQRVPQRREGSMGCAGCFGSLVMLFALAVVLYAFLGRTQVSRLLGEQVSEQLGQLAGGSAGLEPIEGEAAALLPTAVAALPSGEIVISEQQVNGAIASNPAALAPLEQVQVRFTNGRAEADLAAYGTTSTMRAGLSAQGGRIVVVDPVIDGPLNLALSAEELARTVEERINAELISQERAIQDLRVEEGQIVVIVQ
jgi:hypothetical protein